MHQSDDDVHRITLRSLGGSRKCFSNAIPQEIRT